MDQSLKFWHISILTMLKKLSSKRARNMEDLDVLHVKILFERLGGSWEGLAGGDAKEWDRLRQVGRSYFTYCKSHQCGPFSEN